ncbi:hypothetical protein FRX31_016301 [Thalictrum thalictroides]|uniref:Uncharacterized protein n=1 Tax=Thalictrum thalictroides TaxID=46969 RepID=A0A7J6WD27_THATH|nr:hypothetical protein FRX31_016301 [Thalictrum thalictroides]
MEEYLETNDPNPSSLNVMLNPESVPLHYLLTCPTTELYSPTLIFESTRSVTLTVSEKRKGRPPGAKTKFRLKDNTIFTNSNHQKS